MIGLSRFCGHRTTAIRPITNTKGFATSSNDRAQTTIENVNKITPKSDLEYWLDATKRAQQEDLRAQRRQEQEERKQQKEKARKIYQLQQQLGHARTLQKQIKQSKEEMSKLLRDKLIMELENSGQLPRMEEGLLDEMAAESANVDADLSSKATPKS